MMHASSPATRLPPLQPLRQFAAGDLPTLNTLMRRLRDLPLDLEGPGPAWRVTLTTGRQGAGTADGWLATFQWQDGRVQLTVSADALRAWTESAEPGLQLPALPPPLQRAALDDLATRLLHALGNERSHAPRLLDLAEISPASAPALLPLSGVLTMQDVVAQTRFAMGIHTDSAGLRALAPHAAAMGPSVAGPAASCRIALPLTLAVGHTRLTHGDLLALEPGDVVLLDECRISPQGELWLALGPAGIRLQCRDGRYLITQGWTRLMTEAPSDPNLPDTAQPAPEPHTAVDDGAPLAAPQGAGDDGSDMPPDTASPELLAAAAAIPVTLTFDLGQRQMLWSELQALQPGEVFDLARPLNDGPVHVRANGSLIGFGELVDVDGRVGVQISRLGPGR